MNTNITTMRPKTSKVIKPLEVLSDTARKRLGLARSKPRKRAPGEATSVQICNSMTGIAYTTGQGEVAQPMRPGADRAYAIPSRGLKV